MAKIPARLSIRGVTGPDGPIQGTFITGDSLLSSYSSDEYKILPSGITIDHVNKKVIVHDKVIFGKNADIKLSQSGQTLENFSLSSGFINYRLNHYYFPMNLIDFNKCFSWIPPHPFITPGGEPPAPELTARTDRAYYLPFEIKRPMTFDAGVIAENYQNYGLRTHRGNGLTASCQVRMALYSNNDKHFLPAKRITTSVGGGVTFGATAGDFGRPVDVLNNKKAFMPGIYWIGMEVHQDTPQSLGKVNFKMMDSRHVKPILGQNESIDFLPKACVCLTGCHPGSFPFIISDDRGITGSVTELAGTDTAAAPLIYIKPTSFNAVAED